MTKQRHTQRETVFHKVSLEAELAVQPRCDGSQAPTPGLDLVRSIPLIPSKLYSHAFGSEKRAKVALLHYAGLVIRSLLHTYLCIQSSLRHGNQFFFLNRNNFED